MNGSKTARTIFLMLLAALLVCASSCSKGDGQASGSGRDPIQSSQVSGAGKDPAQSGASGGQNTPTEGDQPTENTEEPVKVMDFSWLDGVGNNLSNLSACNDSFAGGFVSDGTYIYFSNRLEKNGLWRMKLDGSGCELYIPEMSGIIGNFNLADGELYYSQKTVIYAANLSTKEIRTVTYASASAVDQVVVIGDRVYWVEGDGAVMTTQRDGSSRPYYCRRGGSGTGGICELTTDGEKLYLIVSEKLSNVSAALSIYELDLSVSCEGAEEALTRKTFAATSDMSGVFYPVNENFFALGTNGFLLAKRYDVEDGKTWKYESVFFDDINKSLRLVSMTTLGTFNEEKKDGSFYWREMGVPKFVLGSTLLGVYNSKYEEGVTNTVIAPHYIYMMRNMDVGEPTLVYTYSGGDFVAGGVYGDKLYVIERTGDSLKLTAIDGNGNTN